MERNSLVLLALLTFLVFTAFRDIFSKGEPDFPDITENDSVIYLAYSETCPHCHTLIRYVQSKQSSVKILATTEGVSFKPTLNKYDVEWGFGVPIMFAVADGTLLGVEGFPDESQDIDGYFMGKDFERRLCNSRGGEPQLQDGNYMYCKLPNGFFLGNKHAVDHILSTCEETQCTQISVDV